MAFQGIDIRATTDRLVFRTLFLDNAGAVVTAAGGTLRLYEVQTDGTLKSYDFNDNTFKTTVLTTATLALTHRTGNNATVNTGVHSAILATLSGFTVGNIYIACSEHASASPPIQDREFQFGNSEGNMVVTATGEVNVNLEQALDVTPTTSTVGESLYATTRTNRMISTTAAAGSTATVVRLTAVPGTDANDDLNGALMIIRDITDSNRVFATLISDYSLTNNACTVSTIPFTPAAGDLVDIFSAGDTATVAADLLKLTSGFSAASPDNLISHLRAIMSKAATAPANVGTYDPATDSLEKAAETLVLMEGAGFVTATDSLQAIRDAIDTLVAPAVVTNTSVSGSGLISDCIGLIRRAVDEPSSTPKYTNADIVEFMQAAFDVILSDINVNTDHPVLVRHNITLVSGQLIYPLPPTCASVWRVAKVNSTTHLVDWEVWPGTEFSGHGQGFSLEGNNLRLLTDWRSTETLQILYVPNADITFFKATIPSANVAGNVTATTVDFSGFTAVTDGTLDTKKNAYAGYMLRSLSSSTGLLEERLITAYDRATLIATLELAFDSTPGAGTDMVFEVVPQYSRLMKHVICLRAAIDILAQEGNTKRMQTLNTALQVKMSAMRRYLSQKQSRFPHSGNSDTMDHTESVVY